MQSLARLLTVDNPVRSLKVRLFACLALVGSLGAAPSHAATYSNAAATFNFIATTTHTPITSWPDCGGVPGDDSLSALTNLGFTFNFGGVDYTQVRIHTNGRLQFNNTACGHGTSAIGPPRTYPFNLPDASQDRSLRIYGADLDVSTSGGGAITFATTGTAPNRIFVVTWNNVSQWKAGGANNFGDGTSYNLQIQVHENGEFYYMYGVSDDVSEPANQPMGGAQIGWQLTSTDFVVVQATLPANNTGLRFFIPGNLAEYRFDLGALGGTAGEVLDSSGNGLNGTRINSPSSINKVQTTSSGKVCQAVAIPGNNNLNQIDAIDTGILPARIGANGAIDFWYKSTQAWGGANVVLFDATTTSGRNFYFARDNNARLRFVVTDNAASPRTITLVQAGSSSVAAGTWKHLGVSWALSAGSAVLTIYVDGVQVATTTDTSNGALHSSLGSLYIGDNRSTNFELGNSTQSANGLIDEFRIYNFAAPVSVIQRDMAISRACSTMDHFAFSHSGGGLTCTPATVTLAAHLPDHSIFTGYAGTVSLSTSTARGDWSIITGSGTLNNGTANDGMATYTFAAGDSGSVALGLKDTVAETVNLNATDGTATEKGGTATASEDQNLTFATTGLAFLANSSAATIGTQIAGKPNTLAPGAQSLELQAIRTSDSTGACEAALAGPQTIEFAYECVSPGTCSATPFDINGTAISGNANGSVTTFSPVSMAFGTATGRAPFSFNFADAGSVRLHARYDIPLGNGAASGNKMRGSSNAFVFRPFALDYRVTNNPGASTAAGSRFVAAGTNFSSTLRAVVWSANDDTNSDGIADGHAAADTDPTNNANLTDNALTANFTPGAAATLAARLQQPVGGTNPGLSGTTAVTLANGTATITASHYDEVGIVELSAAEGGDYLGIGSTETAKIRGYSGFVGRFFPAAFNVTSNTPRFQDACAAGVFTYLDQPFFFANSPVLSVTALARSGTVTKNYTATGFFKLSGTLAGRRYQDKSGLAVDFKTLLGGAVIVGGSTGLTGTATLTLATATGDQFAYSRRALVGPFAAKIDATFAATDLTDSDGVCYDPNDDQRCDPLTIADVTGTTLRFGRLVASNAYGSELLGLAVPARTEYYNGAGFIANAEDTCTSVSTPNLDLGIGASGNSPALGVPNANVGASTTTASIAHTPTAAGDLGLSFSAPGAGNTGDLDYSFDLSTATGAHAEWLRYDWDANGSFDNDPSARISFGLFTGRTAVIYQREPW